MVSTYIPVLALVLLLWLYLYRFCHGDNQGVIPGPLLPVSEDDGDTPAKPTSSTTMARPKTEKPADDAPPPPSFGPSVTLRQGSYVGVTLFRSPRFPKSVDVFRGVPYAQDTSGENRFRPPQPLPESTRIFNAVQWGKVCPAHGVVHRNMSEDCLNANIYRPAGLVDKDGNDADEKVRATNAKPRLPVVVYIHGGGFNMGHGAERNMASFVAWNEAPMVAVNFNYRVGALGFLPSEVTAREGLLNLGLRDQQMLLEWVRDNIEAFGGDPENVTIMGLSAGAHSVCHSHLRPSISPLSN